MLLEEIVTGIHKSAFVLVTDTIEQKGDQIIECILNRHKSKPVAIHKICYANKSEEEVGVTCHNLLDPLGWLTDKKSSNICDLLKTKITDTKIILFIDSLSSALLSYSSIELFKQIQQLINRSDLLGFEVLQIVSIIHRDVETDENLKLISSLASSIIDVYPNYKQPYPKYSLTHYKPNGKYFTETRLFTIKENGKIHSIAATSETTVPLSTNQGTINKPIHDTFSTFRHGLSDEEQKARDSLILPYQQMNISGRGRIEYVPEDADEWDEDDEDPDDDLEV